MLSSPILTACPQIINKCLHLRHNIHEQKSSINELSASIQLIECKTLWGIYQLDCSTLSFLSLSLPLSFHRDE